MDRDEEVATHPVRERGALVEGDRAITRPGLDDLRTTALELGPEAVRNPAIDVLLERALEGFVYGSASWVLALAEELAKESQLSLELSDEELPSQYPRE